MLLVVASLTTFVLVGTFTILSASDLIVGLGWKYVRINLFAAVTFAIVFAGLALGQTHL